MTSEQNNDSQHAERPRPTRAQRIVAAGFLGAFGLTIITVLLTGLWVRAPRSHERALPPPAAVVERTTPVDSATPAARAPEPPSQPDTAIEGEASGGAAEPHEGSNASGTNERAPADRR